MLRAGAILAAAGALACVLAGCGGNSHTGEIKQVVGRLQAAGYQVTSDRPISHQIEDNSSRKYTPELAFTILRPGTEVFVNLSVSSDPGFMRAFREQGFRAVAIRGDRAYGLSSAGSGGSPDLARILRVAEGS